MRDLPRQLNVDELAQLFEGRTRFILRLAHRDNPLAEARALLRTLPEDELLEALNAHPRVGDRELSAASASEQGRDKDPAVLADLARLNRAYEERFGFRFIVFVNHRSKTEILREFQTRLQHTREEEIATAIEELVSIAEDRYRRAKS